VFARRKDTQVKIRGFRIELTEISTSLVKHPSIRDALVTTRFEDGDQVKLIAYIIPNEAEIPSQPALRNYLLKFLPDYMLPSIYVQVDSFPLTPNGKIDINKLPPPDFSSLDLAPQFVSPRTEEEKKIANIWCEILKIKEIGVYSNFYDLGGHSLLAIQIISKIEAAFSKSIPLAQFMGSPTVEGLAKALRSQETLVDPSPLVVVNPDGSKPPIFCVPPAASTAMRFKILNKYLGGDQPLYSFEYPGMDGKTEPLTSIPAMASTFNEQMLTTQPQGPYYLLGLCYGGNVAFEMAQQLLKDGHEVAFLVILDSNFAPTKRRTTAYYVYKLRQFINTRIMRRDRPVSELILRRSRWENLDNDPIKQRIYNVFTANIQARLSYTSPPYPGKIIKFSTMWGVAEHATKQWRKMTTKGLENHKVPGVHSRRNPDDTGMMDEPNVQVLATKLQECLEKTYRKKIKS
jgi:thioesterase domain-containing protein/acyl carrier protein